jgi:hypothetical protein
MKHYTSSVIEMTKDSYSYLSFVANSEKSLNELDVIHNISFCSQKKNENGVLFFKECIPAPSFLINYIYKMLLSTHLSIHHSEILKYLFIRTAKPFFMALSSLIFKGELPHPDDFILQLNEKDLGYVLKTDDNDIPYFLHQQINEIVQIGNNFLIMMQEEEREYYNLCKTDCYIEIKFEPSNIDDTHKQFMEKLDLKYALLKQKQYDLRYQEERNKYLKLQKKVDYLRRIKLVHWLIDNLYKC